MKRTKTQLVLLIVVVAFAALTFAGTASAGWTWDSATTGWTWDGTGDAPPTDSAPTGWTWDNATTGWTWDGNGDPTPVGP